MPSPIASPVQEPQRTHLPRARGRFVSHVLTLATGNGLAQVIQLAGTLLLARLIAPESFGSFALFLSLVSFVSVLGGARYELAIMLPERDEEAANVLFVSVAVLLGIAGLSLLPIVFLHQPVVRLLGDERLSPWLWAVPFALVVNGLFQVLGVWHGRMKRFRRLALGRVVQALGTVAGQLGLLAFYPGGFALVGGWLLGQSLGAGVLLIRLFQGADPAFVRKAHDWKVMREVLSKYRNFPLYKAPYSFIGNASSQMVVVTLRVFADLHVVGLYSLAARAVYLPVYLITSSMNDVFYEKAATELKHGGLESFVNRLLRIQVVLAAPLLILTAFDIRLLFGFFLGERWAASGTFAAILAFASFLYFLTSWLDRLFDIRGRQKLSLVLKLGGNVISLAGMTIALWRTGDAIVAVAVFTAFQVLYTATWLLFAYHVAGFKPASLLLLLRDGCLHIGMATAVIGAIHLVLAGWPAFWLSALAAVAMMTTSFLRHGYSEFLFGPAVTDRWRRLYPAKGSRGGPGSLRPSSGATTPRS